MPSKYGLRAYGNAAYSRDFQHGRVVIQSHTAVAVIPEVRIGSALFAMRSQSNLAIEGRLLWDRIPVGDCAGAWAPIGRNPCAGGTP